MHLRILPLLSVGLFLISQQSWAWGFAAHRHINQKAVFSLPIEMLPFYKANIAYITEHAVDPDKRRYASPDEGPRHYIDLDRYLKVGEVSHPREVIPLKWLPAVEQFGEEELVANGIVPWHVQLMLFRLTTAFRSGDTKSILDVSAELGHYVADAHVPLHTTENYNGQLTGQRGIHGLWETAIPATFDPEAIYYGGNAEYIEQPEEVIWNVVWQSHLKVDSVLTLEKELDSNFPSDQKYAYAAKGQRYRRDYSPEYVSAYDRKLDGMVLRRMMAAINCVASMWYTAWVNAGQPDLPLEVVEDISKKSPVPKDTVKHKKGDRRHAHY